MNKRVAILFACIAIFIVLVVLGAAVFVVREITVLAPETLAELKPKIVSDSNIKQNTSIFSLSEERVAKSIEKSNPYVMVVDVERVFPNSVRIRVEERKPIIGVKLENDGRTVLLDEELKILEITDNVVNYKIVPINGYILSGIGNESVGSKIADNSDTYVLSELSEIIAAMKPHGFIGVRFAAFIKSINLEYNNLVIMKTVYGAEIVMRTNTTLSASQQFDSLYSYFCNLSDKNVKGYIYVDKATGVGVYDALPQE